MRTRNQQPAIVGAEIDGGENRGVFATPVLPPSIIACASGDHSQRSLNPVFRRSYAYMPILTQPHRRARR
jgi:hypothetical protein